MHINEDFTYAPMRAIIKQVILDQTQVGFYVRRVFPDLYKLIIEKSLVSKTEPNFVHESIFMFCYGLKSPPKCLVCDLQPRRFKNIKFGYVPCCKGCKAKSEWRKEKFKSTCLDKFGSTSPAGNSLIFSKIRKTKVDRGLFVDTKDKTNYENYRDMVRNISEKQQLASLPNIEKRGHISVKGAYQLDHRYSIFEGFRNKIPPNIIGHICNLQMLPGSDNYAKKTECSITLEELYKAIKISENF